MNTSKKHFVKVVATRTLKNLEAIDRLHESQEFEFYEVTQLLNSCLGLLVFPQEEREREIPVIRFADFEEQGWPSPEFISGSVGNSRELIRFLRNAITHCDLRFEADDAREIRGLRVWNKNRGRKTTEAKLTIADLRKLLCKLAELMKDLK